MKGTLLILLVLFFFHSYSQLTSADVKEFGSMLNYYRKTSTGIGSSSYMIMQSAFPNHSHMEIYADLETIGEKISVFDKFCYFLVLNYNGNRDISAQLINGFCGSATLSLKIVDYIKVKFKDKLIVDIAAKQMREEKMVEDAKKQALELEQLNKLKEKKEQEEIAAKEKFAKENVMASFNGGSWSRFLGQNLKYPNISPPWPKGQVIAAFIIKTDGKVDSVRIVSNSLVIATTNGIKDVEIQYSQSEKEKFNDEVIRFLKLTTWIPALKNNKIVEEEKTLPFSFGDNSE